MRTDAVRTDAVRSLQSAAAGLARRSERSEFAANQSDVRSAFPEFFVNLAEQPEAPAPAWHLMDHLLDESPDPRHLK